MTEQQYFKLPDETLRVASSTPSVSPSQLSSALSATDPRLSFYSYPNPSSTTTTTTTTTEAPQIVYIYTCPTASRIKDRMLYSTSKRLTWQYAEQAAGVAVAKSIEVSDVEEITAEVLAREFGVEEKAESKSFARPKRPGRR